MDSNSIKEIDTKLDELISALNKSFESHNTQDEYLENISIIQKYIFNKSKEINYEDYIEKSDKSDNFKRKLMADFDYYERVTENRDADKLLNNSNDKGTTMDLDLLDRVLSDYNKDTLTISRENLSVIQDLGLAFETFVMVGCGSLAHTLLSFKFQPKHKNKLCIGIDREKLCINDAKRICDKFNILNLRYERVDGVDFHYDVDGKPCLIFVASLVKDKKTVLDRIAETAVSGSYVVIRNPVNLNNLMYEYADGSDHASMEPKDYKANNQQINEQNLQEISVYKIN